MIDRKFAPDALLRFAVTADDLPQVQVLNATINIAQRMFRLLLLPDLAPSIIGEYIECI